MKHLFFVRHGLSEMNLQGRRAGGGTDTPLAAQGHAQAHAAGEQARELGIQHIVSSPQRRAHDTAIIIADKLQIPELDITVNSLFAERHLGALEGMPWRPNLNVDNVPGVEAAHTLLHRMRLAYDFLQSLPFDNILVVSHGATGRALRHIVQPEIPFVPSPQLQNGQIVQLL